MTNPIYHPVTHIDGKDNGRDGTKESTPCTTQETANGQNDG